MIMQLWVMFSIVLALALCFLLWPLLKSRKPVALAQDRLLMEENVSVFNAQLLELQAQQSTGRISESEYHELKLELERNLLNAYSSSKGQASSLKLGKSHYSYFVLILLFAAAAWFLYLQLGAASDLKIIELQKAKQLSDYQAMLDNRQPDLQKSTELIEELEQHLTKDSENLYYWFLLARLSGDRQDYAKAAEAYQQILDRDQSSGMVMAELAQAKFLRDQHKMSEEIGQLIQQSLALEPNNTTALGLSGIYSFYKKDYVAAIRAWQKAINLLGSDSLDAKGLSSGIEKAKAMYLASGGNDESLTKMLAQKTIKLSVAIDSAISLDPSQLVFVYAREWNGSKMPLAITRVPLARLPTEIVLTEDMAMSPQATLATANQIELVARISQDGSPNAKQGDWQVSQGPV